MKANRSEQKARTTLDSIRHRTTPFQRELLDEAWQQHRTNGQWPILRKLYSKHDKQRVRKALSDLGRNIGWEQDGSNRWKQYRLSLLGVLLTKDGRKFQALMVRFFEFQRNYYQQEPNEDYIKPHEVAHELKLSDDEAELLGQLLSLGSLGGSDKPTKEWGASAMEEAEDFPKEGDLSSQFEQWLLRSYQHNTAVFQDQRHTQYFSGAFPGTFESLIPSPNEPHPPEIAVSLNRFRSRYPDTKKLGFLIMRFTPGKPFQRIVNVIKKTAEKHGLLVVRADENQFHADLWGHVRTLLHGCAFGIAVYERIDTNEPNANVGLEVGYLMAMNKPVLLLKDKTVQALQSDLAGKLYMPFDPHNPEASIPRQLTKWLEGNGIILQK
jgi:hypothetical protein